MCVCVGGGGEVTLTHWRHPPSPPPSPPSPLPPHTHYSSRIPRAPHVTPSHYVTMVTILTPEGQRNLPLLIWQLAGGGEPHLHTQRLICILTADGDQSAPSAEVHSCGRSMKPERGSADVKPTSFVGKSMKEGEVCRGGGCSVPAEQAASRCRRHGGIPLSDSCLFIVTPTNNTLSSRHATLGARRGLYLKMAALREFTKYDHNKTASRPCRAGTAVYRRHAARRVPQYTRYTERRRSSLEQGNRYTDAASPPYGRLSPRVLSVSNPSPRRAGPCSGGAGSINY